MVEYYFNEKNLAKHGITPQEVEEAIDDDNASDYPLKPSRDGNDRAMIVGETLMGRRIEIGIEFVDDEIWNIYHAMDAGPDAVKLSGYLRIKR